MHDFSLALREYRAVHGHLQQFSERLGMDVDMVIWSDDLAVPIITEQAVDLVPALLRLLDFVRKGFALRGFQLNLAKGKTGLVATFCGTNAQQCDGSTSLFRSLAQCLSSTMARSNLST